MIYATRQCNIRQLSPSCQRFVAGGTAKRKEQRAKRNIKNRFLHLFFLTLTIHRMIFDRRLVRFAALSIDKKMKKVDAVQVLVLSEFLQS
jgi:hypothetical protein